MSETPGKQSLQPFTYAYYTDMLKKSIDEGYVISSFEKYDPENPRTIILRHDVDYTFEGVMILAEIEEKLNCSASYFFRVHADEYNLFSCHVLARVLELPVMGHEVGLHSEAMSVGRALKRDPQDLLKCEKRVIESILGFEVRTCAEHRDISSTIHRTPWYHDMYNPYEAGFARFTLDKKYFNDMKYLSESNAHWREGDLLEHIGKHDRFQVLIHPDWWFKEDLLLKGPYHHPKSIYS